MTENNNQPGTSTPTFAKGQEVWVKATLASNIIDRAGDIKLHIKCAIDKNVAYASFKEIYTTEQILLEHGASAQNAERQTQNAELPDRTRPFRERDHVRLVERWGRPPLAPEDLEDAGFKLNEVYEVAEDEDRDCDVKLKNGVHYWYFKFCFLELVEPAPEPKYWVHESPKTYSIYYKGQFGRVITAMLMQKDLYTIEEAQEQCDKLNQKG